MYPPSCFLVQPYIGSHSTLVCSWDAIAESYERIHRGNLVGMGVVPLQFLAGETPTTLGLTGQESYTITLPTELTPGMLANVTVCVCVGGACERGIE